MFNIKKKYKRYKLFKKLKRYRYLRDHNEFNSKYGQALAYIFYCEEYDNSLESLLKLFGKDMVRCLFYGGMIHINEPNCLLNTHLYDTEVWKKYNKE